MTNEISSDDAIIEDVKDGSNTQEKECENDEDEIEESVPTVKEALKDRLIELHAHTSRGVSCGLMWKNASYGLELEFDRSGNARFALDLGLSGPDMDQKFNGYHKMDSGKKRTPDYTDIAYREAVSRLRYLLAESYAPSPSKYSQLHHTQDSDNETEASFAASDRSRHGHTHSHYRSQAPYRPSVFGSRRALYSDTMPKLTHGYSTLNVPHGEVTDAPTKPEGAAQPPTELMAFIERQEEYIEQLEKESQFCREELSHLLGKVKEVISENEGLHEKEKAGLLKSVFDSYETGDDEDDHDMDSEEKSEKRKPLETKKKRLEGPSIVFESRISELEAQLTQTKLDLKKALEEADLYKKKLTDQHYGSDLSHSSGSPDLQRQQIDTLQRQVGVTNLVYDNSREKDELSDKVLKLQASLTQFREKEADASLKAKRSLDVVDQTQFEKAQPQLSLAQADLEVRRLKEELDRQHDKLRELLQEQARKIQDERTQAERRYAQQVEQLSTELAAQWDNSSRLQLELEKQRRTEQELRRDLQQKIATVEELKKELSSKTSGLQSEVMQAAAERGSVEQELAVSRMTAERAERDARQETSRLQAEVTALRQRLDRADADVMHSRRENLRLAEQVASLERELANALVVLSPTAEDGETEVRISLG
uniref:Uncharacterized protein n=1 Tax=Timema monikensis TaxID=170555 RepID=A0A7R9EC49_9NEOP|nr:unnamed protein product [Timema monikensis]